MDIGGAYMILAKAFCDEDKATKNRDLSDKGLQGCNVYLTAPNIPEYMIPFPFQTLPILIVDHLPLMTSIN